MTNPSSTVCLQRYEKDVQKISTEPHSKDVQRCRSTFPEIPSRGHLVIKVIAVVAIVVVVIIIHQLVPVSSYTPLLGLGAIMIIAVRFLSVMPRFNVALLVRNVCIVRVRIESQKVVFAVDHAFQ